MRAPYLCTRTLDLISYYCSHELYVGDDNQKGRKKIEGLIRADALPCVPVREGGMITQHPAGRSYSTERSGASALKSSLGIGVLYYICHELTTSTSIEVQRTGLRSATGIRITLLMWRLGLDYKARKTEQKIQHCCNWINLSRKKNKLVRASTPNTYPPSGSGYDRMIPPIGPKTTKRQVSRRSRYTGDWRGLSQSQREREREQG